MGAKENKEVVRKVEEAWDTGKLDALDTLFDPKFNNAQSGVPQLPVGLEGAKMAHRMAMSSFPDRTIQVQDIIAEGDKVVVRCRMIGTNTGGVQWAGAPANGNKVDIEWISVYTLRNGKIVDHVGLNDVMALMTQLGVMPAPGA